MSGDSVPVRSTAQSPPVAGSAAHAGPIGAEAGQPPVSGQSPHVAVAGAAQVPAPRPDGLPRPSDGLAGTTHDPDERGYFGSFGGRWLPEALVAALDEVAESYRKARIDPDFLAELDRLAATYAGRPSPLTDAARLTEQIGGARILLKREDLNHTGSHKINNVLGQALLAKRMGKTRVIVETGAGQHGVATATAAALLGMECRVYMGRVDTDRQALNVARMQLLGSEVVAVES